MNNLRPKATLSGHFGRVWCVKWNSKGTLLASCGEDKTIRIWKFNNSKNSMECVQIMSDKHTRTIRYLCWSPCDTFIASAGFDSSIFIWDVNNNDAVEELSHHKSEVKSVAWSTSGKFLASCGRDKTVNVYSVEDDFEILDVPFDIHAEDVKCTAWHPHEDVLVSCGFDNRVCVIREVLDEWSVSATLLGHDHIVRAVEFNRIGDILASCGDDKTIRLWIATSVDMSSWRCAAVVAGEHVHGVWDLSWGPGGVLASCGRDNRVCVYGVSSELARTELSHEPQVQLLAKQSEAHEEDINSISWRCPDSQSACSPMLATASDDWTVRLWTYEDPDMQLD